MSGFPRPSGSWGVGPFENSESIEWLESLAAVPEAQVLPTIRRALGDGASSPRRTAAAEIIARACESALPVTVQGVELKPSPAVVDQMAAMRSLASNAVTWCIDQIDSDTWGTFEIERLEELQRIRQRLERANDVRLARSDLDASAAAESAVALEPFLGAAQKIIDDDRVPLNPKDEGYLRAELAIIRDQHRLGEGADPYYITRAIGKTVKRLLELRLLGTNARNVLEEMDAYPPEVVDEIVDGIDDYAQVVADRWASDFFDPTNQPSEASIAYSKAADCARRFIRLGEVAEDGSYDALRSFVRSIPMGAGHAVGAASVGFAASLAIAVSRVPGADAAVLWLIDATPRLLDLYTHVKSKTDAPSSSDHEEV